MSTLLEVVDLHTEIRRRHDVVDAVDGVSLTLRAGETVGLVGESGCGKTMTARSVMRLLPPGGRIVAGSVRMGGQELTTLPQDDMRHLRGRELAMTFQEPLTALNPTLSVGRQVAEPARLHRGLSRRAALDRAAEALGLVGVPHPRERLGAYPHELSGGLRQRCLIAMAFVCEPALLIADEPTTALDVTIQAQILELLNRLRQRLGMGLLLATHDLGVVAGQADRVMVMRAGRIVETAATDELFAHPRHPYAQSLLAAIPAYDRGPAEPRTGPGPGLPPDPSCPAPHGPDLPPNLPWVSPPGPGQPPDLSRPPPPRPRLPPGLCLPLGPSTPADRMSDRASPDRASPDRAVLEVVEVTKEYPTAGAVLRRPLGSLSAIAGVSFTVRRGETLGLVGESGCGKSTLARLIVALERPTSGRVLVEGTDLGTLPARVLRQRRRAVQLVFQDPYASLDPRMRVGAALREPLQIRGAGRREQDRATRDLLGEVGLSAEAIPRFPHELSTGQRQRVGLARALASDPALIVADEPVSSLDASTQAQILGLMRRLQAERGLAYVFISHDLSVVRSLADRVGVMYLGKLMEIGPSDEVYRNPAHPYTAGLVGSVPIPDPVRERGRGRPGVRGEPPSPLHPPTGCRFRTRCPLAQQVCAEIEPPLRTFAPGHLAACHFPLRPPAEAQPVGRGPDS